MKRLILTTLLIIQTTISIFALFVSGTATQLGKYNSRKLYILTGDNITLQISDNMSSYSWVSFHIDGKYYKTDWSVTKHGVTGTTSVYWTKTFTFSPSTYFGKSELHSIAAADFPGGRDTVYIFSESQSPYTSCSNIPHTIYLNSILTQRWERSSQNGLNWTIINCTLPFYTESTPTTGTYLYRALNGDGTYSAIKQVTYVNAVPTNINISPATNTKTVDESVTLTASTTNATYSYQWFKDGTAISNATTSSYSIPIIKATNAGSYSCTVSNGCNSVTSLAATLAVNKAAQVITFPDIATKTYGDAAFTLPATTDKGLTIAYQSTNTAVATLSGNTVTIVAPGTTNIIASQTGTADYLAATGVTKTLTVNKIAQTITLASTATKTFGDVAYTLPASTDKSKTITYSSSNTAVATVSGNTVTIKGAGTTDITATQAGDTYYYAAPTVTQTLTVNKANQIITFSAFATKTYGDAAIILPSTSSAGLSISYSSNNTAVASVSGNTLTINKAGSATITATQTGNANYTAASSVSQEIIIQKANQTIVWSNIPNKTFGDASFTLPTTTDKGLTIAYQSADVNIATVSANTVTIKSAGTVNITASQVGTENYNAASSVTLPLSISKATQTITFADLPVCTYGGAPLTLAAASSSGLTVTYESSDYNIASLTGNTLTIGSAGTCYITASVAGNVNYLTATPVQKLLTVNKANQTVTFDAIADKTYGDTAINLTASANTILPVTFSSSAPAKLIISGNKAIIAGAGTFTVTATQSGNSNYNTASATITFTVNKASLITTADNKTRLYGDANPTFTVSYSGFVNGDTKAELASLPVAASAATATSTVGTYDITLSTITDANYALTYRKGTLTVNKAPLTVTANNATKVYGDANPTFGVSYSGFKNSETSTVLTTVPVFTTLAKTMSNIGTYDLIGSGGAATNYDISYINGQLTITKALLKVYASDTSRMYGDANPTFDINITGYKGSDDATVLTANPSASCSALANSSVGSYNITCSDATADNYQFDYTTTVGKLTIKKAVLTVNPDNQTKFYGDVNPALTYTFAGFKNNENSSVLITLPTVSTIATITSSVGSYNISAVNGVALNYSFTYNSGLLTINKAPLTVTANNATKVYGNANPSLTLRYSGFKNNQTSSVLSTTPTAFTTATTTSNAGDYEIVADGGVALNYLLSYVNGKLTITKAPLVISAKNDSINKGAAIPSFTLVYSGFKGADDVSKLDVLPSVSCSATPDSQIGNYDIVLSGGSDKNYNYTLQNGLLKIKDNTGINDINSLYTMLYPVPTNNKVFIKSDVSITKVEVYSIDGRLILLNTTNDIKAIDLSELMEGTYLFKLHSNTGIATRMVIKK